MVSFFLGGGEEGGWNLDILDEETECINSEKKVYLIYMFNG